MKKLKSEYFECECQCYNHTLQVLWDQDEWMKLHGIEKELYIDLYLNHFQPWYKRVWIAICYIFKKESCRPYDCIIMNNEEATRLRDYLSDIVKTNEEEHY